MKTKLRPLAALLALVLLLGAGCGKSIKNDLVLPTAPATEPAAPNSGETSLGALRQQMADASRCFAVAYLGYHYAQSPELPVDISGVLERNLPELLETFPFLGQIPQERIVGYSGDLFCIVALDADAAVAVSKGYWDGENGQYIYDDMIYSSMSGEPILPFCNNDGWEPDTQIYISGSSGESYWCPEISPDGYIFPGDFHDFTPYAELLQAEQRGLVENGWISPAKGQLIGTTWNWYRYLEDGTEHSCTMFLDNDFLTAYWNDGEAHVYYDAPWELTYEKGTAILTVDFGQMAGVLRYNLLYQPEYGQLYVSLDTTQPTLSLGAEPLSRYMTKADPPQPAEMVGTWELGWTEVEGQILGAEPGSQTLTIIQDQTGLYWISYINLEYPGWSFSHKELVVFPFALYDGCGNDQWSAAVNFIGFGGTEYRLTLLPEGTLLLQNYWETEGAPRVSYGWYTRISD